MSQSEYIIIAARNGYAVTPPKGGRPKGQTENTPYTSASVDYQITGAFCCLAAAKGRNKTCKRQIKKIFQAKQNTCPIGSENEPVQADRAEKAKCHMVAHDRRCHHQYCAPQCRAGGRAYRSPLRTVLPGTVLPGATQPVAGDGYGQPSRVHHYGRGRCNVPGTVPRQRIP